jgi:hypothetical protein
MVILHYAYLVLKMPGLHGVMSIGGDVKWVYDCDKESYEVADRLATSTELKVLKEALAESPTPPPNQSWLTLSSPKSPFSRRM